MTADINYLLPLAIIGFIGLVVGLLVGFLMSGVRGASRKTKQKRNRDLDEVIRIWLDRRSGELSMEIGGKFYKKVDEFSEKSRRGFAALINELQSWSSMPSIGQPPGGITTQPVPIRDQQFTKPSPSEYDEGQFPGSSSSTIELPVIPLAEIETKLQPTEEIDKVQLAESADVQVTERRSRLLTLEKSQETSKESTEETKSIAAQVDEVLQEKLASTAYKDQGIRLLELPNGGMVVMVNDTQYDGVNEVPDPEVRLLIQESVAEWERRLDIA